jgi:C_GCAxxG_C_C family probable redox protein
MESKENEAIQSFRSGANCAQAVLTTYSDDLNLDNYLAMSISSGFGGGMGRLQETCGAVTGAFMVLGLYNSNRFTDNQDKKEKTYSMIQKFSQKFRTIHGSIHCSTLLNCDLKTNEGQAYMKENKLVEKVCEKCISTSIGLLEELLEK